VSGDSRLGPRASVEAIVMRFREVGTHALLVEVDDLAAATAVHQWILRHKLTTGDSPRDIVPAARSVLLDGADPAVWREVLGEQVIRRGEAPDGELVVVPTQYDGADLAEVAAVWGCTVEDFVARHQGIEFMVAFCGFAPGFAYCAAPDPLPQMPRRIEPRERVPAGSVALAGEFCGVYPNDMPGGWQLIGHTSERLFDPERDKPALLQPGDRVRFEATS